MNAFLLLARHAEHSEFETVLSGRTDDAPLSARGRDQAAHLGDRLADLPVRRVYSSPRRRAAETARIVARRLDLPVQTDASFDEIDFGDWTGRSFAALADDPSWRHWNSRRDRSQPPGGETMKQAITRSRSGCEALLADGDDAVVFTHGDIIRGLVTSLSGRSFQDIFAFDVDPCGIVAIERRDGSLRLADAATRLAA